MGSARLGADPYGARRDAARFPGLVPQGVSAELVAEKWGAQPRRSSTSTPSALARARGRDRRRRRVRRRDRPDHGAPTAPWSASTSRSVPAPRSRSWASSGPSSAPTRCAARFPEIDWKVTAGNSSQITDGASALLVMSAETAPPRSGSRPRARIVASAVVGDDPVLMLTGPIPATDKVLGAGRPDHRPDRRRRGQRGVRLRAAGLAGGVRRRRGAAQPARRRHRPRPPARRLGRPADDHAAQPPRADRRPLRPADACARPAAWPTPPSSSSCR